MDGSDAVRGWMSGLQGRMSGVAGCLGYWAGCPGSGSVDELEDSRQNSGDFVDGNWGKDGEKLDLLATHEIRGSNPTKLHHTNRSQKKIWGYFRGDFRNWGRTQQNQARKRRVGAPNS